MSADSDASSQFAATLNLQCIHCGNALTTSTREMFRFLRTGWPECCHERMLLSVRLPWPERALDGPELTRVAELLW
jgi:hypothetical protein